MFGEIFFEKYAFVIEKKNKAKKVIILAQKYFFFGAKWGDLVKVSKMMF